MAIYTNLCILCNLGINAWLDIRKKQVSLTAIILLTFIGFLGQLYKFEFDAAAIIFRIVPGAVCFFIAFFGKEAIGYGDAWMILSMGILMETGDFYTACFIAFFFAGIAGISLLLFFHKGRKYEIPFVPFLWIGFVCMRLIE